MPFTDSPSKVHRDDPRRALIDAAAKDDSYDARAHSHPAIRVACPACDALPNERCYASRKPKHFAPQFHAERVALTNPIGDTAMTASVTELKPPTEAAARQADAKRRPARKSGDPRADRAAKRTQPKPEKPAPKPQPKPEPKPEPELSATARKRVVAAAIVHAAADLIDQWGTTATAAFDQKIPAADARAFTRQWLSYLPVGDQWDERLGERSDAGRRNSR